MSRRATQFRDRALDTVARARSGRGEEETDPPPCGDLRVVLLQATPQPGKIPSVVGDLGLQLRPPFVDGRNVRTDDPAGVAPIVIVEPAQVEVKARKT
ncbi:hypothetical protein [Rhodoblastus sp.]|uniref:hypothetical protein n=1 Tax=Rhodoblastus sp. TaxID=1962975 RepID=UPI0035B3C9FC